MLPKVLSNITFEHLGDETLAFSPATGKAHCLSVSASIVMRACVDQVSREEAVVRLRDAGVADSEEILSVTVASLHQEGLLESDLFESRLERREFLAGAGAAAAAVFAASVVAPAPALAASCQNCTQGNSYVITNLAGLCTATFKGNVGCKCCPAGGNTTCVFVRQVKGGGTAYNGTTVPENSSQYQRVCHPTATVASLPVCMTGAPGFGVDPHPNQRCRCTNC